MHLNVSKAESKRAAEGWEIDRLSSTLADVMPLGPLEARLRLVFAFVCLHCCCWWWGNSFKDGKSLIEDIFGTTQNGDELCTHCLGCGAHTKSPATTTEIGCLVINDVECFPRSQFQLLESMSINRKTAPHLLAYIFHFSARHVTENPHKNNIKFLSLPSRSSIQKKNSFFLTKHAHERSEPKEKKKLLKNRGRIRFSFPH